MEGNNPEPEQEQGNNPEQGQGNNTQEVVSLTPEMLEAMLNDGMKYVAIIEPMLGLEEGTFMGALQGNPESEEAIRGKMDQFSSFVASLESPLTSATDKITGVIGAVFSYTLGALPVGTLESFPDEVDQSTGIIRILGEIGNFLQNVDALAAKMTGQTVQERAQHLVKIYVAGLDAMVEAGVASAVSMLANDEPDMGNGMPPMQPHNGDF